MSSSSWLLVGDAMSMDDVKGVFWWHTLKGGRRGPGGCLKVLGLTIVVLVVIFELIRRAG